MRSPDSVPAAASAESRGRGLLRLAAIQVALLIATLVAIEIVLRVVNLPYLRLEDWNTLNYRHDDELGWMPIPNTETTVLLPREIRLKNNSLGLRDIEFVRGPQPAILVLGDSNVWGYNVTDGERFTSLIRAALPSQTIVNAGVSGYGTDQEFLLLQRLWDTIEPKLVVLIFCVENDRQDNSSNVRYSSYKPYLAVQPDGTAQFRGQPVPQSRRLAMKENGWAQRLFLARLAISVAIELRHPRITVPDPTERLIAMMRDFVAAKGAKLVVGLQYREPALETFLQTQKIPFTTFDGGEQYESSKHWTPEGNKLVAARLMRLLVDRGALKE
jgi:hypothetical protein